VRKTFTTLTRGKPEVIPVVTSEAMPMCRLALADLSGGVSEFATKGAMRLLRGTAAVFFDLLGASLLARLSPLSSKVAKTRKWIKAYLLCTLSERREGGDRLAAAPTPSQTFHALEGTVAVSDSSWSLRPRKTVRSAAHI
jgi:hypothetical protein